MNYVILVIVLVNLMLNEAESVVVRVEQGRLRGERLRVVTHNAEYLSFKGIPYAKPPIGDLRFRPPQLPEPWTGVRNATQHGSVCVQRNNYNIQDIVGNEDCLFLNVYTPRLKPKKPLPVMLFIHGGAYITGSGNVDRYGPDYLITEDIVLVTINYRLGPLGFLALNTNEVPGNAGLKDQVAAMRWVQRNIAVFGGDSNKVTIFGQSVGAASVGFHNLSPMTKGLYKRAVMMSGAPLIDWAWPFEPKRLAFRLGQQLGLWTLDDKELVTYLKMLPAEKLFGTDPIVLKSEDPNVVIKHLVYTPSVETHCGANKFLNLDPVQALNLGKIRDVDLMIGHVELEGLFFFLLLGDKITSLYTNYTEMVVPRKILENTAPVNIFKLADIIRTRYFGNNPIDKNVAPEMVDYVSDTAMNYGVQKYARLFSKFRRTFMYKFSVLTDFPRHQDLSNEYGINGPAHEDDLLYLFYPHSGNVTITEDSEQYTLVKTVCALYANFAKYGNPTPNNCFGVKWREYKADTQYYLDINSTLSVGQHLDAEVVSFWDSIYKAAGLAF